ncbi:transmembrane protein 6/97 [Lasiosphaeria miniovina]|uniref:Efficient mitochondria targeting-associated protein 19 n=1 Tax=Lasiosphaeria miniovina TaxID=1954250 RepID=A0AA40DFJ3_9PEZI|nr:transmembrane protein 6/97 [Lasiosphaeria miniovina]KAK0701584.1 transmembrane protein 6/97 [Lasiosphaeria miniovina]
MAVYNTSARNHVWLAWFVLQVPIIVLIDGLDYFFPSSMYEPAGAPLHFAYNIKQDYVATYNDPIGQWSPETASGHDSWMGLFLYLEFAFILPAVLYAVFQLGVMRRGTSGATELLLLLYGFETALTTLVCIHDVAYWDPAAYSPEVKRTLTFQLFGPWFAIPFLMSIDMACRILARFKAADAALASKKGQ